MVVETPASARATTVPGRILAALYVAMSLPAAIDLLVVRRTLIVPTDAEATATNLLGAEPLFRLGIGLELATGIVALCLASYYYGVFARYGRHLSRLLVLFVAAGSALEMATGALGGLALTFVRQPDFLLPFEPAQLNAACLAILAFQTFGYSLAHIFWGLWLLPLGLLAIRSGAAPRFAAIALMLAGLAYVASGFATILLPAYARTVALLAMAPEGIGEIGFLICLVVFAGRSAAE